MSGRDPGEEPADQVHEAQVIRRGELVGFGDGGHDRFVLGDAEGGPEVPPRSRIESRLVQGEGESDELIG